MNETGGVVVLRSCTTNFGDVALSTSMNKTVQNLRVAALLGEAPCLRPAVLALPAALLRWDACQNKEPVSNGRVMAAGPSEVTLMPEQEAS